MTKDFVILLIATLITVTGWIIFELKHVDNQEAITQDTVARVEPLDPELDLSVLDRLK